MWKEWCVLSAAGDEQIRLTENRDIQVARFREVAAKVGTGEEEYARRIEGVDDEETCMPASRGLDKDVRMSEGREEESGRRRTVRKHDLDNPANNGELNTR